MEIIIQGSQLLLSLSILVVLHELGHFIPAKLFKTKVEKFYLFFDWPYSLFKKKIGDTVYGIGVLPLGGYVKIAGMIDESMDTEQMSKPAQPWEFRSKPSWQRLIIMLGGVSVNFILALFIYIGLSYIYPDNFQPIESVKGGFEITHPVLLEAGFKTGDKIVSYNNIPVEYIDDLSKSIIIAESYQIEREGEVLNINLPIDFLGQLSSSNSEEKLFNLRRPIIIQKVQVDNPDTPEINEASKNVKYNLLQGDVIESINGIETPYQDQLAAILNNNKNRTIETSILRDGMSRSKTLNVDENGKLGIIFGASNLDLINYGYIKNDSIKYNFIESIPVGSNKFIYEVGSYVNQFITIFTPSKGAYKGVGGFIAIGKIFPTTWDWHTFWHRTALLSIMLAVLNLLPIPALDGGHVMFLLYEMVSGRKPSDKFMEYAQTAGFLILLALVLFANGNDIFKAIFN
ncbi:RIP metalloprotease RseP [Flavobacteriaceae bacterium]|nr:RIP metalloprotease RseP [Flavobacteriaceae bacterium]